MRNTIRKKYLKKEEKSLDYIFYSSQKSLDNINVYIIGVLPIFELLKFYFVNNTQITLILTLLILIMSILYMIFLRLSFNASKKASDKGLYIITDEVEKNSYNENYKNNLFKNTRIFNYICNVIFYIITFTTILNIILLFKNII